MTTMIEVMCEDGTKRLYEAIEGDFIEVKGLYSANAYWYKRENYNLMEGDVVKRTARLVLMLDGNCVGYYNDMHGIYQLIEYYLRRIILYQCEVA